jgi:hypothetical protein
VLHERRMREGRCQLLQLVPMGSQGSLIRGVWDRPRYDWQQVVAAHLQAGKVVMAARLCELRAMQS